MRTKMVALEMCRYLEPWGSSNVLSPVFFRPDLEVKYIPLRLILDIKKRTMLEGNIFLENRSTIIGAHLFKILGSIKFVPYTAVASRQNSSGTGMSILLNKNWPRLEGDIRRKK